MKKCRFLLFVAAIAIVTPLSVTADPVVRMANGANAAAIRGAVDQFREDLGGNNGVGGSFTSGRREISWDDVPDALSAPFITPGNFYNSNSPRGAVFTSPCAGPNFRASSNAGANPNPDHPDGNPVRFGELDPSYTNTFTVFSGEKLFTALSGSASPCNMLTVNFFIPGTSIPATVSGFGVVFTDVDAIRDARVLCFDRAGNFLAGSLAPPPFNGGLSFVGVSFNAGERISECHIVSGNAALTNGNVDGVNGIDVVAMDDFIYGEPRAADYHEGDFDGDGTTDTAVFRPSTGQWFVLNSGSATFSITDWGVEGDIPVVGDYDGDRRSDFAIYRPTTGTWFILNSSNNQFAVTSWGLPGDKPEAGDFDKDGKSDIAVYRPSDGNHFIRSSTGAIQIIQWGVQGDIPINGSPH